MISVKAVPGGIRVSGVLDTAALVLVVAKGSNGEERRFCVTRNAPGFFSEDVVAKNGFYPVDFHCETVMMKTRSTLYVMRPILNPDAITAWFKCQGLNTVTVPYDMHVTVAYSKAEVEWSDLGSPSNDVIIVPASDKNRPVSMFGGGALVQQFESPILQTRWADFLCKGASWDHPAYSPHVTISYASPLPAELLMPYTGPLVLGPEQFSDIGSGFSPVEKAADERKSPPKGYPKDRSEYALPDTYEFPIDDKHIHAAVSYFHSHRFADAGQKRSAAKRILSAARRHGVEVSDDSDVARAAHGE